MKGSPAILSSRVRTSGERIIPDIMTPLALFRCAANGLELQTKVREDFTITEKAPSSTSRAFSWLKVPASVFIFKTLCLCLVIID